MDQQTTVMSRPRPDVADGGAQVNASAVLTDDDRRQRPHAVTISPPVATEWAPGWDAPADRRDDEADAGRAAAIGWLAQRLAWEGRLDQLRTAHARRDGA